MGKRDTITVFLGIMLLLLSLSVMSVAASPFQTNIQLARVDQGPSPKPMVDIIYPKDGATLEFGTHTINVSATDLTEIVNVKIKIDGPEKTKGWVDITASKIGDNYYYDWTVGTEGDYSITARATNTAGKHADDTVGVTVTATTPAPDFTLDASPSTLTIVVGSNDTSTITVGSLNGFNEPVDLTVSGQPANVTATLNPTRVTPPPDSSATSTLTVTVDTSATLGTYTLTVTGTNGSLIHSIDVGLEITAPPSVYTLTVHVQDEGDVAIENATVTVDSLSSTTDSLGNAVFPDLEEGTYTVTASKTGYTSASDTVILDADKRVTLILTTAPAFDYELFIEIDYIEGHAPNQTVLDYIELYYMGNNPSDELISVTFYVNDSIPYVGAYAGINDDEFWDIEAQYNDHDYGYYSKWKWVLYGTTVENEPNVFGYAYVLIQRGSWDTLAGNYIFIADKTADDWAVNNGIKPLGAEAVVLMHEMGHSIGIGKYHPGFGEIYDPDPGSVMSKISTANAGKYTIDPETGEIIGAWYYSDDYWATRNMGYYTI